MLAPGAHIMRVRALKSFAGPAASPTEGDLFEVPAPIGLAWITAGLVERAEPEIETAVARAPETAVAPAAARRGRR